MNIGINLFGLSVNSLMDIRTKRISLFFTCIYGLLGLGYHIYSKCVSYEMLFALIPGILCLILAGISREQIGYGDGAVLLAMGCNLSADDMFLCCFLAIIFAGAVALFLIGICHKKRNYEIPFVPFLLMGYLCTLLEG